MNAVTTLEITERNLPRDIEVIRVEANLGAEIRGLNLAAPLTDETRELIRALLWEHQVLFFRDTGIDDAQQAQLGLIFGEPEVDSIAKRRGATPQTIAPMNTGPYSNAYYGT